MLHEVYISGIDEPVLYLGYYKDLSFLQRLGYAISEIIGVYVTKSLVSYSVDSEGYELVEEPTTACEIFKNVMSGKGFYFEVI